MKNENPRGYFKYILAADSETSGIAFGGDDPSYDAETGEEFQAVSWGFLVLEFDTLKEVDRLYVEIKHNGDSGWNPKAEAVHGLSKQYLAQNGVNEEQAVEQILSLIIKYWGPDSPICMMGHNVAFDLAFFKRMTRRHGVNVKFGNRMIDTNSIAAVTFGTFNSDDFFDVAGLPARELHNSLEDICYTVESVRRVKMVFNAGING